MRAEKLTSGVRLPRPGQQGCAVAVQAVDSGQTGAGGARGEGLCDSACNADRRCARRRSITEGGDTFYTDWEETFDSFDTMGLHENLLRGIYACAPSLPCMRCLSWGAPP